MNINPPTNVSNPSVTIPLRLEVTKIIEGSLLENETAAYSPTEREVYETLVMPDEVLLEFGEMASDFAVDWVILLLKSEYGIR